ncbi:MAG: RidA family protein [Gemmatimonadaceae bacterium]
MTLPTPIAPAGWPRPSGFSNGVSARGRIVATAGQIGWDPVTMDFPDESFAGQCAQTFRNVLAVLRAADAGPEHIIRLTWYITSRDAYNAALREVGIAYRDIIGRHYPAMAVIIVAGLIEPRAMIEIEATAVVPDA